MEGTLPSSKEQQKQFGFYNIKTALVNTLEVIQNTPNNKKKNQYKVITKFKEELKIELKKLLKVELTMEFKEELLTQKTDIIITTNTYVQILNLYLHEILRRQMAKFSKEISLALTDGEGGPKLLALPPPPSNPPNM